MYKVSHLEPSEPCLDFILLPYGEFYEKTKALLDAKSGDTIRFFNGPECRIHSVHKIPMDGVFSALCQMRYGFSKAVVLRRWQDNARTEGHGRDIISKEECILVFYAKN